MSKHRSQEEWIAILDSAARSGLSVSDFCKQNNISKNLFYRNSLKLGYTNGGKRTEKWAAAVSGTSTVPNLNETLPLVPVPIQTVRMAWTSADSASQPTTTQLSILHGSFQILVEDGFSSDTLRRVLEVMRNA